MSLIVDFCNEHINLFCTGIIGYTSIAVGYDKVKNVCDGLERDLSGLVLEEEVFEGREAVSIECDFVEYAAQHAMDGGGMQG